MPERMRLTVGGVSIDLSPTDGFNRPENRVRQINKVHGSRIEIHEFGDKELYELPLINIAASHADSINSWYDSGSTITFTPDLTGAPGGTILVTIANRDRPMQMWAEEGNFDNRYAGVLELYETSSSAFSSSSSGSSSSSSALASSSSSSSPPASSSSSSNSPSSSSSSSGDSSSSLSYNSGA